MPKMTISVITPSLNQSDWLRLCVASVADQGGGVEHIIQDAGSTDGTLKWLESDPRVRLFAEQDTGMYDAVNRGLQKATGEVAAYLNCDEQYLPGVLRRVARFFESHPEAEVVFGNVVYVNESGEYLAHRKMQVPRLYHTWVCHLSTLTCAMFFRRQLVTERGFLFDPSYRCNGDAEWMVRLLKAGVKMAALGEFTSVFTCTGNNLGWSVPARAEWRRLRAAAPWWVRAGTVALVLQHRWRRWRAGAYRQAPFTVELYTRTSPAARVLRQVQRPNFRTPV